MLNAEQLTNLFEVLLSPSPLLTKLENCALILMKIYLSKTKWHWWVLTQLNYIHNEDIYLKAWVITKTLQQKIILCITYLGNVHWYTRCFCSLHSNKTVLTLTNKQNATKLQEQNFENHFYESYFYFSLCR